VVNPGNGCAGLVIDRIEQHLPIEFVKVNYKPDGTFPNGIPNPLLPENRASTADAVRKPRCRLGLAWDGDFDRCFLFDEQGEFIEGYYMSIAGGHDHGARGKDHPRAKTCLGIDRYVTKAGGTLSVEDRHAFIKDRTCSERCRIWRRDVAHHYLRTLHTATAA